MVGEQDPGVMVLSLRDIFEHVNKPDSDIEVSLSYLEIYNEQVRSAHRPGPPPLCTREGAFHGAHKRTRFVNYSSATHP